ncbi:MAG TPA: chromate efflux transporter [Ideonella sp.]|uniref:chromate efflux transporter n=1 Tax=Ideonella sp. TaxID=1929293 RepID=UPI002BAEA492|nr:chromate efflux transporter [Ideonella sp.]HSI47747.1 chromate efflux transporter [Ideonella sp.]
MNTTAVTPSSPPDEALPGPRKALLFADCMVLGLTAWGGFMALLAQAQTRFVKQRQWLSEQDFGDLIALVVMLPGPQAVNALAVMGYRLAGWGGFAAALAGIVLPGFVITLMLWGGYALLAQHPDLQRALMAGVLPPLAMILGQAAFNQAKKATPGLKERGLAVVCGVLLLAVPYWGAAIYVLAMAALVALFTWPAPKVVAPEAAQRRLHPLALALCIAPAGLALFQVVPALLPEVLLAKVGLVFGGLSTTLFGGGLVMVPMLEGLIVDHLGWLDHASFSAGLAASQVTPGPILSIATFTGMQVAGLAGALIATVGIYLPTAVIAVGVNSMTEQLKGSRRFQHAMLGVRSAVVGLIAGGAISLLLKLPGHGLSWQGGLMVAVAWLLVWRLKQPPYLTLPVGVLLAWLML